MDTSVVPHLPAGNLQRWLWTTLTLGLAAWVFYPILVYDPDPTLASLGEIWASDDNYSHGFLIGPLALYFVWGRRHVLRNLPVEGSAWGLPVIGFALLLFLVGTLGGVNFLPRLSAVCLLFGGILWIGGAPWIKALAFPVLFLLLAIPPPRFVFIQLAFPLQVFASEVAEQVLFWVGVPILREGNVIHLPHTQLEVAEACSGLRSLQALVTVGVVFAYFFGRGWVQRVLIVLVSLPIAIAVNALRVTGTGYLAYHYGLEVATGYYHTLEGFAMFGLAFGLLTVVGFALIWLVPTGSREGAEAERPP
jgi:exosortase